MGAITTLITLGVAAVAASGDIVYVSSLGTHEVLRYNATTGAHIDTFITAASGGLSQPHAILERCDDILVASFGNDRVLRYDRDTGAFIDIFLPPANGLDQPTYLQYGPDGNLYVSSQGSDEIQRYTTGGVFVDAFVSSGSGGLDGPSGFAFGPDGRLYVAGRYSANLIAYDAASGDFEEVIADATDGLGAGSTFGLNFGDNGDLYFASNGSVFRYDLATEAIVATIPVGGAIGIELGPAGNIFVATSNNLRVVSTVDNSVSGFFLSGGVINTLNFFRFPSATPAPCCLPMGIPAVSSWGVVVLTLGMLAAASAMFCRSGRASAKQTLALAQLTGRPNVALSPKPSQRSRRLRSRRLAVPNGPHAVVVNSH